MMLTGMYLYVCRSCVMRMYSYNMSSDTPSGILVFHTGVSRHSASCHLMGFLRPQVQTCSDGYSRFSLSEIINLSLVFRFALQGIRGKTKIL